MVEEWLRKNFFSFFLNRIHTVQIENRHTYCAAFLHSPEASARTRMLWRPWCLTVAQHKEARIWFLLDAKRLRQVHGKPGQADDRRCTVICLARCGFSRQTGISAEDSHCVHAF